MIRTAYRLEIETVAMRHELPPDLVEAMVLVESSGHTDAFRFEPAFFARYQAPKKEWAYALTNPRRYGSSYGLMQIMLAVAREVGFTGVPEELFVPEIGLEYGCRKLAELCRWAERRGNGLPEDVRLRSALASYNGGHLRNEPDFVPDRNAAYADKVLKLFDA